MPLNLKAHTYRYRWEILIFLTAFGVRWLHLQAVSPTYPFFNCFMGDSEGFHTWALRIANGEWIGTQVFRTSPLYPYILGVLYSISAQGPLIARFLQMAADSLSCVILFKIGRSLFDQRVAFCAAFFAVFYRMFIFYDSTLNKEAWVIFFSSALLYTLIEADSKNTDKLWGVSGAALGFLTLLRGNLLLLVPAILCWLFYSKQRWDLTIRMRWAACFMGGALLIILPATLHNYIAAKDFVLISNDSGLAFFEGNRPGSDGTSQALTPGRNIPDLEAEDMQRIAENAEGRALKPSEANSYWLRKTVEAIQRSPAGWSKLLVHKTTLFFRAFEIPDFEDFQIVRRFSWVLKIPFPTFGVICPLGLLGMWMAWPRVKTLFFLYLFAAISAFSVILFTLCARYRFPTVLPLMLFAAYAVVQWADWIRGSVWKKVGVSLAAGLALSFWVNRGEAQSRAAYLAGSLANLGICFNRAGNYPKALEVLQDALQKFPQDSTLLFSLGNVYATHAEYEKATTLYQKVVEKDPYQTEALFFLGLARYKQNRMAEAKLWWEKVLQVQPAHSEALQGLRRLKARGY